jgi:hypothetical protein
MAVGAFVNAEIEKRGTMISEKRTPDILVKTNLCIQPILPAETAAKTADTCVIFDIKG